MRHAVDCGEIGCRDLHQSSCTGDDAMHLPYDWCAKAIPAHLPASHAACSADVLACIPPPLPFVTALRSEEGACSARSKPASPPFSTRLGGGQKDGSQGAGL